LLAQLALQTRGLVSEGSVVGRGWVALMRPGVYTGRALPLAWRVRTGKQGHLPEALPSALVAQVHKRIPAGVSVVRLGDGACDGTGLQQTLAHTGGSSVCRTGCHMTASWQGETFRLEALGWCIKPGTLVAFSAVLFTEAAYGPLMLIWCWANGYQEPRYVVTHLTCAEEACRLYGKRFRIDPCCADQKSRGFCLHKAHISDSMRLSRVLRAVCFAYSWIVYVGALCLQEGGVETIHRRHRCALSVCQLGLSLLDHFLNEDLPLPVVFSVLV
jgi:hypothetical protein